MWIKRVEIENFKSFLHLQTIEFGPGFNLVLGANNAGKSTVLQASDLMAQPSMPHRSVAKVSQHGSPVAGQSRVLLTLEVSVAEIRRLQSDGVTVLPLRQDWQEGLPSSPTDDVIDSLLAEREIEASVERRQDGMNRARLSGHWIRSGWLEPGSPGPVLHIREQSIGRPRCAIDGARANVGSSLFAELLQCSRRIYRFDAHRRSHPQGPLSTDGQLQPSAENLAGCINWLQTSDTEGHRQLCEWVHRVLPHVYAVQAPPITAGGVQLRCHPRPSAERRDDLAMPIDQMGSGVANVVAVLYIVLTARQPQVICIDEPNQFLHPKALRELLNILALEGRQHQYILTAHSAEVISAVKAETVTLLSLDNGVTQVRQAKHDDLAKLRDGLADLGIRATELHGRDRVLWVEGQTEELVLPAVLASFCTRLAAGTAVLRVHETGAFERRGMDPVKVAAIYKRLSSASALVPPMVAALLDRERRRDDECQRLEEDQRARLRFLPRRMIENYLLHPPAIAAVLEEREPGAGDVQRVAHLLGEAAGVRALEDLDLIQADGARLLAQVFARQTDSRWEFKKTRDVPDLVDWLLVHQADLLTPLGDWLNQLLIEAEGSG